MYMQKGFVYKVSIMNEQSYVTIAIQMYLKPVYNLHDHSTGTRWKMHELHAFYAKSRSQRANF